MNAAGFSEMRKRNAGPLFLRAVFAAFSMTLFSLSAAQEMRDAERSSEGAPTAAVRAEVEHAAENETAQSAVPQPYRRVHVPAEMMESIPNRGEPYWPVEAEKFEKWTRDVKAGETPAEDADADLTVKAGYYQATFEHGALTDGAAVVVLSRRWETASAQGRNPAPQTDLTWRFRAGNFAISRMLPASESVFDGDDALSAFTHSLKENARGGENSARFFSDGTAEMVFRPAELSARKDCLAFFQWTQQGRQAAGGGTVFDLHFFPGLDITLDLLLPANHVPTADHGQARRVKYAPSQNPGAPGAERVLWRFYFGGHHHVTLKIMTSTAGETFYPLLVSQENRVSFHKNGLNLTARLEMDMPGADAAGASTGGVNAGGMNTGGMSSAGETRNTVQTPVFLKALVDTRLALTSVTYNRRPISWAHLREIHSTDETAPALATVVSGGAEKPEAGKVEEGKTDEEKPDAKSSLATGETPVHAAVAALAADAPVTEIAENPKKRGAARYAEILLEIPGKVYGVGNVLEFHAVENPAGPWEVNSGKTRQMPAVAGKAPGEEISGGNVIFRSDVLTVPKIMVRNVFWSEGKSVIRVYEPFMMTDISPQHGRILSSQWKDLTQDHRRISMTEMVVQEDSQDAEIRVKLVSVQPEVRVDAATVMDFRETEISAVAELSFTVTDGERFALLALVDPDWTVDSVDSVQGAESSRVPLVEDWNVEQSPHTQDFSLRLLEHMPAVQAEYARSGKVPALLRIQLFRALTPGDAVSLRVRMRRPGVEPGHVFSAAEMSPVLFPTYECGASWFLAGTSSSRALKLTGGPVETAPAGAVAGEDVLTRARAAHDASFFQVQTRLDAGGASGLRVEHWPATYDANIKGFYDLTSPPHAVAIFTVMCEPRNSSVDKVQVYIRPATSFEVTWKFPKFLEGSAVRCLEKVPLDGEERLNDSYETWEITLAAAQTHPFQFEILLLPQGTEERQGGGGAGDDADLFAAQIAAFRSLLERFPGGVPLNLVALPEARQSSAAVTLRENVSGNIIVTQQRMTPILTCQEAASASFFVPGTGFFRHFQYAPETLTSRIYMPFLKLSLTRKPEKQMQAWVWRQQRQSQFFPSGLTLHVISWDVENMGEEEFIIRVHELLKRDAHILGVLVDGQRVPEGAGKENKDGEIRIPLPSWKRQVEVTLQWMEKNVPLRVLAVLDAALPETNFQVLNSSWQAWVPDNYTPIMATEDFHTRADIKDAAPGESEIARKDTVLYRFFGELASGGEAFFVGGPAPSLGTLTDVGSGGRAFLVDEQQWLSLVAISQGMNPAQWDIRTGWTPYTLRDAHDLRVIHSSALEASRWFLLLGTFLIFSRYFQKYRATRIGVCGLSAALCLVTPPVFSPIFSGIFLGFVLSFALHSALRRRKRFLDRRPKVIHVYLQQRSEKKTTKTRPTAPLPGQIPQPAPGMPTSGTPVNGKGGE